MPSIALTQQHSPPAPPPLSQALRDAIQAASIRADEGQRIFAPIATLWDDYVQSETVRKLPPKLRKPLLVLCQEISRTATRHFDAYIKGTRPSPALTLKLQRKRATAEKLVPVELDEEFVHDGSCEWAYVIDIDAEVLEVWPWKP
ncbi:hypothetical protein VE03_10189 [Pseudogymnoascus sp. 23342-1-I1]|nr:hypothetical protein VE03_10189 [Pseudogymnoascus sp. 23342-1-I1]